MQCLYNCFVRLYSLYIKVGSLVSMKAKLLVEGRKAIAEQLRLAMNGNHQCLWFHVSSLGEFEQGKPLIMALRKKYPDHKILLTFFSPSGYEVKKNDPVADIVCYMPADTPGKVKWFLDQVNPAAAFFIKYDFWFNFLQQIQLRKIPVFYISAVFREEQYFFKSYGKWFLRILKGVDHFFVQEDASRKLLEKAGIENVTVSGDTRFDRVIKLPEEKMVLPFIEQFKGNSHLIIAGSTWPADEDLLYDLMQQQYPGLKLLIVPHEVSPSRLDQITRKFKGFKLIRYSLIEKQQLEDSQILLLDSIGMLSKIYHYADLCYIGGGFGKGIHNILEAAVYDKVVLFGPNHQKFREAKDLIQEGGAFKIENNQDIKEKVFSLTKEMEFLKLAGRKAGNYVRDHAGATYSIVKKIQI